MSDPSYDQGMSRTCGGPTSTDCPSPDPPRNVGGFGVDEDQSWNGQGVKVRFDVEVTG